MCLAISKPARAIIPVEHLEAGYEGNPHGCGFCYPEGGKVVVVKGLLKFDDFLKQYKEKEHLPMLVHFRVSTHGKPNFLNCHPFSMLSEKYALIHNGMIPIHQSYPELSDTGNFAKLVIEPLAMDDADYAAVMMANRVFGGSFSSRLVRRIRDVEGLSYYIHSSIGVTGKDDGATVDRKSTRL